MNFWLEHAVIYCYIEYYLGRMSWYWTSLKTFVIKFIMVAYHCILPYAYNIICLCILHTVVVFHLLQNVVERIITWYTPVPIWTLLWTVHSDLLLSMEVRNAPLVPDYSFQNQALKVSLTGETWDKLRMSCIIWNFLPLLIRGSAK